MSRMFYLATLVAASGEILANEMVRQGDATPDREFTPESAVVDAAGFFASDEHYEEPEAEGNRIELHGPFYMGAPVAVFTVEENDDGVHDYRVAETLSEAPHIAATFRDAEGVEVESAAGRAPEVIARAAAFLSLHGTDPDENGAAASAGSVDFAPAS